MGNGIGAGLGNSVNDSALRNPVFVVGVLRSGTSLLYSLLNQHPQMAFMYECDAWNFPELFTAARLRGNWLARQEFFNQALSRHRLIYGGSLRGLENVRTPDDLYTEFGKGKGAALWGEKSPFYCCHLERLAKKYPNSPFVLIWRDPVEVYRSIVCAGRSTRFFRRPGMLSRLILYQEEMILQAAALEKAGTRVHHVTYADLIDKTSEVCRDACEFLGVPFDSHMLDLHSADLSAVYHSAQHNHLRSGVIQRQDMAKNIVAPPIAAKLERFRNRWSRLNPVAFQPKTPGTDAVEPSFWERARHRLAGKLLCLWDDTKRVLFEFLPFVWLRTYRETAQWFLVSRGGGAEPKVTLRRQIAGNWLTILVAIVSIVVLERIDSLNPHFSLLPFYMIPCAILALTMNWRWGTAAAIITACIGPALLWRVDESFAQFEVFLWNSAMRFLLYEFCVIILDRIRREVSSRRTENVQRIAAPFPPEV